MAHLGCPVAGDDLYGATLNPCGRIALHACRLEFRHPATGQVLSFESPLPDPIRKVLT